LTEYTGELRSVSAARNAVAAATAWWWLIGWWLAGRAVVFLTAIIVAAVGPVGYLRSELAHGPLSLLNSWDGLWYQRVASAGYLLVPGRQSDPAFFPLYPLLLRATHELGLGFPAAGLLISNAAFLAALVGLYDLTRLHLGGVFARRATRYLAVFPLGYVFSMTYPESLVLALTVFAATAALRGRWLAAALCAGGAALARPEALLIVLPLAGIAWRTRDSLTPRTRGLALGAVLAPAAGLAAYPLYLARALHDPLAWNHAEQVWGRRFTPLGVVHAFQNLPTQSAQNYAVVRDVAAVLLYLALLAAARRARVPTGWLLAGTGIVILPIFSGTFESTGRFGLLAPAIFWGLANLGRRARADRMILALSMVLLVAATTTIPFMFP
jgi:hypothetical protein